MTTNSGSYLKQLHQLLNQHFDLEEFRFLCFELDVDYDSLRGEGKSARIREMLLGLGRNGRLPELITVIEQERPQVDWPPIPGDLQLPAVRPPYFAYSHPLQKHFQGRLQEREQLSNWLLHGGEALYTLVSIGGMGKSSLVWVWLLHDVLGRKIPSFVSEEPLLINNDLAPFQGVFWWSFQGTEGSFSNFLDKVLSYLAGKQDDNSTPHEKAQHLLHYLQTERILLILDNFEEELQVYSQLNTDADKLPTGQDVPIQFRSCTNTYTANFLQKAASMPLVSRILITTRLFPAELDGLAGCHRDNLQPITHDDAKAFLIAHGITGTEEGFRVIFQNYGYHPLTLRLIAGLIINDLVRPGDVEAFTQRKDISLPSQRQILALSYDSLSLTQRTLLSRLAAFRANIAYNAILAINPFHSEQLLQEGLRALIERELLHFDRQNRLYSLHPIIHHYAYARLVDRQGVHTKLRNYFAAVPPPTRVENLQDLSPVIELYHHTIQAGLYDEAWDIYNRKLRTPLYYHLSEYEYDLQLLQTMPTDDSGIPPLTLPDWQVWWLLYQTMCYERIGQLRKGLELAQKALSWSRKAAPVVLAQSRIPYASLCCDTGQLEKALQTIEEACDYFDKGVDNNWQGISHRSYSRALLILGRYQDAWLQFELTNYYYGENARFKHGRSVLQAHKATWYLWQEQYEEAVSEAKLGITLSQQGNYEREFIHASYLLGEALIHQSQTTDDLETSKVLLSQAREHLETALDRCQRTYLVELEGRVLLVLAQWFTATKNWERADIYAQQALKQATDHHYRLVMADACILLAKIAQNQAETDQAKSYIQQAQVYAGCDSAYRYEIACKQIKAIQSSDIHPI